MAWTGRSEWHPVWSYRKTVASGWTVPSWCLVESNLEVVMSNQVSWREACSWMLLKATSTSKLAVDTPQNSCIFQWGLCRDRLPGYWQWQSSLNACSFSSMKLCNIRVGEKHSWVDYWEWIFDYIVYSRKVHLL